MVEYKTFTHKDVLPIIKGKFQDAKYFERCLVLIDQIGCIQHYKPKDNAWVQISMRKLQKLLGSEYAKIIVDALKELGILEVLENEIEVEDGLFVKRESYSTGNYSKSYKLNDKYYVHPSTNNLKVRKITNNRFLTTLRNYYLQKKYNQLLYSEEGSHIYSNLFNVGIDVEAAIDFIITNPEMKNLHNKKSHHLLAAIYKIENEQIYSSRSKNGRLVSTFTNLKSELRQFLFDKTDGEFDFVEVDICNAQPLLVAIDLEEKFPEVLKQQDFLKFRDSCRQGLIYDNLSKLFDKSREDIKQRFMDTLLFTKDNKEYLLTKENLSQLEAEQQRFTKKFKDNFPTVWNKLLEIKSEIGKRKFAINIQRLESTLMIDHVLVALKDIGTNFSIHDSIVCRTADALRVQNLITEKFMELYNSPVTLKVKNLYENV